MEVAQAEVLNPTAKQYYRTHLVYELFEDWTAFGSLFQDLRTPRRI